MKKISHSIVIPESLAGKRLDQAVAELLPEYSRSRLTEWIKAGVLTIEGKSGKPKDKVLGNEAIVLETALAIQGAWEAEDIPLSIVYEDEEVIVVNKPVGLVVHPAVGNHQGTLLNALLHYAPELATVPRAGIVHRLDKGTSGLLLIARTVESQQRLVAALQEREIKREYRAIVQGVLVSGGTIDEPLGRHPRHRTLRAVMRVGKPAITHYRVQERFRAHTDVWLQLETGRTHQIRVHLAYKHYPVVGDPEYGGRSKLPTACDADLRMALQSYAHQALHAWRLSFTHPRTEQVLSFEADLPADMVGLISWLRRDREQHGSIPTKT